MGVTMAGTRILWGEVREIGEGRSNSFNTQRAEMKVGYLRVCYRASDNPAFIWKVALSIARYLALCLSRSLGSRFDPSYPAMQWIHHKWQQPDPSYPAITWPLLPRHAMLRGHRDKHANLSPGVNIECEGEGGTCLHCTRLSVRLSWRERPMKDAMKDVLFLCVLFERRAY